MRKRTFFIGHEKFIRICHGYNLLHHFYERATVIITIITAFPENCNLRVHEKVVMNNLYVILMDGMSDCGEYGEFCEFYRFSH